MREPACWHKWAASSAVISSLLVRVIEMLRLLIRVQHDLGVEGEAARVSLTAPARPRRSFRRVMFGHETVYGQCAFHSDHCVKENMAHERWVGAGRKAGAMRRKKAVEDSREFGHRRRRTERSERGQSATAARGEGPSEWRRAIRRGLMSTPIQVQVGGQSLKFPFHRHESGQAAADSSLLPHLPRCLASNARAGPRE